MKTILAILDLAALLGGIILMLISLSYRNPDHPSITGEKAGQISASGDMDDFGAIKATIYTWRA